MSYLLGELKIKVFLPKVPLAQLAGHKRCERSVNVWFLCEDLLQGLRTQRHLHLRSMHSRKVYCYDFTLVIHTFYAHQHTELNGQMGEYLPATVLCGLFRYHCCLEARLLLFLLSTMKALLEQVLTALPEFCLAQDASNHQLFVHLLQVPAHVR